MNEENLTKLIESTQKNQQISTVVNGVQIFLTSLTTIVLVAKAFKRHKPSLNVQMIRKKGEIAKEQLRSKNRTARLHLELAILEKEMTYQTDLSRWKSGSEKSTTPETNLTDNNFPSQVVPEQAQQAFNKVNKGLNKVKEVADRFKGLKDKFTNHDNN